MSTTPVERVKAQALATTSPNGLATREEFGATQALERSHETASTAAAAIAKASTEARYIMAWRNPRNMLQVRQNLLEECRRPSFANNTSVLYRKPVGKGVEGLGIRFVEAALRHMTNVLVQTSTIYDDEDKRIVHVVVTDLESNMTHEKDVTIIKRVERARPEDDGTYFSKRTNSSNKPVYTVRATEDDMISKEASLISKCIRTEGLRIIPGDLQDEAENIIRQVRLDKAAEDPDAEIKNIQDAFSRYRVSVTMLEAYLGHPVSTCVAADIVDLRSVYAAIKEGEATWQQIMDNRNSADFPPTETVVATKGVEAVKAKVAAEVTKPKPATAAAKTEATPAKVTPPIEKVAPKAEEAPVSNLQPTYTPEPEPAPAAEEEYFPPQPAAEDDEGIGQGETKKGVVFPLRVTRKAGEPEPDEALKAAVKAEIERLGQKVEKLTDFWMHVKFDDLTVNAMKCYFEALSKIPTPAAKG